MAISELNRTTILSASDYKCFYCGEDIHESPELDHIIPRSRGGSDDPLNLLACCKSCNCSKRNLTTHEMFFREWAKKYSASVFLQLQNSINYGRYHERLPELSVFTKEETSVIERISDALFERIEKPREFSIEMLPHYHIVTIGGAR